ncbi:hypothetical protein Ahy_B01g052611 [Arachis hypogaea]|uniref:Uncharacterized protein n=1 Tax=Arachis hypogaea TaxID=3818 RepID=A0A445APW4_ARAHY|nr:hypothetical protein Ahy_B01g052611 [Arachis hypogaea]
MRSLGKFKHNSEERGLHHKINAFHSRFYGIRSCRVGSEELTEIMHRVFGNVMAEIKGKSSLSHEEATLSGVNDLQSPPRVRTRGRPKNRMGSNTKKKIANATKKKKKAALNGGSMIQSSSSLYDAHDMNCPGEDDRSFEVLAPFALWKILRKPGIGVPEGSCNK